MKRRKIRRNSPEHRTYLSHTDGMWRVIWKGIPLNADTPSRARAEAVARKYNVKLPDVIWTESGWVKDIGQNRRRGLRRNPTETVYLTQVGRNLYVGNFHSPGGTPAFNHMPKNLSFWNKYAYEKNKKLVMSRHAYMARGLRRNGADHKRHRWQIFGYDVWGNAEDGWEVNNVLPGPVITMSYKAEYDAKTFDSAMARARVGLRWKLIDEGASDEDTIYFNTVSGKPLGEMRRVK